MKNLIKILFLLGLITLISCNSKIHKDIEMYSQTWDEIINNGNLELFNESNFTNDVTLLMSPENVVGIDNVKDFYNNYLTGFSNIKFTIVDVFGQNDKIVKHWNFKGIHSGDFFGISATGKTVNIDGVTLVKMKNGKIAQEQDFMDNVVFMKQLGLVSSPENVGIVESLYKAFDVGDIPSVLGLLDDKVIWNEAEGNAYADGNPYIGPEAVLNGVFARVGGEWDGFKLVDVVLHDMSNNQVLATLRYNGTYKKTKKIIDAQVAHHWTLANGKVTAFQQHVDTKQLADVAKR